MKVYILIHQKHGHVVGVYSDKSQCVSTQEYLNSIFNNYTYKVVEQSVIYK